MTKLCAVFVAMILAGAALVASPAPHARVAVTAVDSQVTEQGAIATATFKIQIVNQEDAELTGLRVAFDGGIEVVVGDVAAESTLVSGGQKFVFDTTDMLPTKSFPVPVTVKFSLNGVATEMKAILAMKRAE
jgi:hypothetical protein